MGCQIGLSDWAVRLQAYLAKLAPSFSPVAETSNVVPALRYMSPTPFADSTLITSAPCERSIVNQ